MGLLDDAIREHLELKRLRGADPGEVAREEKDALGPVPRKNTAEPDEGASNREASSDAEASLVSLPPTARITDPHASHVSQETVEINMEAELAADIEVEHERKVVDDLSTDSAHSRTNSEESLEWEMPNEADTDEDSKPTEPVEDVLEETPDFLRDTPEQDRLWFEQRPPRDFDFNE